MKFVIGIGSGQYIDLEVEEESIREQRKPIKLWVVDEESRGRKEMNGRQRRKAMIVDEPRKKVCGREREQRKEMGGR